MSMYISKNRNQIIALYRIKNWYKVYFFANQR